MYEVKLDEEKRGRSDKTAKRRESSATQHGVRTNQTAAKVLKVKHNKTKLLKPEANLKRFLL